MNLHRAVTSTGLAFFVSGLLVTASARAEVFDGHGLILSAERVAGFGRASATSLRQDTKTETETEVTSSRTGFAVFGREGQNAYTAPRFAVDFRLPSLPELTLGGAFIYDYGSLSAESRVTTPTTSTTTIEDGGTTHLFALAPRAGWLLPLNESVVFWPRGGFTIYNEGATSADGTRSSTNSGFGLNLEPTAVIELDSHLGLNVGAVLDLPLAGTHTEQAEENGVKVTTEYDLTLLHFGLNVGLTGWL